MSEHYRPPFPDKPKGWKIPDDAPDKEIKRRADLAAAWDIVRRGFLSGGGGDPQVEERRLNTLIEIQNNQL